jgi:tetratricopeptide (TPR) repeat protein
MRQTRSDRDSGTGARRGVAKDDVMRGLAALSMVVMACTVTGATISTGLHAQITPELERAKRLNVEAVEFYRQGRFAEGLPKAREVLQIRERALGPRHPDVANSLNTLALLLQATGDYAGTRPLFERALRIWEQALGPEHPTVATSLNNLAESLRVTGDYAGARPLYERSLRIWEQALGPRHPDVALSLNNLALLLQASEDRQHERPPEAIASVLGPTSP